MMEATTHSVAADRHENGIAVVGLAGRFPGAGDIGTFWRNLCDGVESISALDESRIDDAFDAATRAGDSYVRSRGILENVDRFDAEFFGIHAREAQMMDPQHRVLLETAWEALEDAGLTETDSQRIGVYAGCSIGTYLLRHVMRDRQAIDTFTTDYQVGSFNELLGNGGDFLATRLAYKLNLRGPAMTVQSACSTALLAIAQAVQALRAGHADAMLAGAVSITFPQQRGYLYQDGGMVSRDGHCRTFDAGASGTVFGAGAGVVVLKRLADARAAGDRIYAVIRGIGINNDGSLKVGYSAPSIVGQAEAVSSAHRDAAFEPSSIDYVECHGTATPMGDPIEVAALARAFAGSGASRCALGSVKPNVGHLDVAAGMAGFIKTALAVWHETLPPTINFESPNPRIDFDTTPFVVATKLGPWPQIGLTRRAGVSAFGVGGTNVHVVLESEPSVPRPSASERPELFVVSGRNADALSRNVARVGAFFRENAETAFDDAAATLQLGRRHFPFRRAIVAANVAELVSACDVSARPARAATVDARVAFVFPGQGSQYVGMGRELYAAEPVFRKAVDRCVEISESILGVDLRAVVFADESAASAATLIGTNIAQPALFTVSYALAELLRSWDIVPAATIGHSVGEFVSATLAGVFTLETALRIVCERGRLMQALEPGSMLAVRLPASQVAAILTPDVSIAAINSTTQTVIAGPHTAIDAFEALCSARGVLSKRVATSHAFHSSMMEPMAAHLASFVASMSLFEPTEPYVSTVTGDWIRPDEATSPTYWAEHASRTVRFDDALATLLASNVDAIVEVGPGATLASNARQRALRSEGCTVVSTLVPDRASDGERGMLLAAVGTLWERGVAPNWHAVRGHRVRRTVSLPTYAFEPTRYWIDASAAAARDDEEAPDVDPSIELQTSLATLLEELSGERVGRADMQTSFLELGFDSLFLGRFAQVVASRFDVSVTFRQLLGELPTLAKLAAYLGAHVPVDLRLPVPTVVDVFPSVPRSEGEVVPVKPSAPLATGSAIESIMRDQLAAIQAVIGQQLRMLEGATSPQGAAPCAPAVGAIDTNASRFEVFRFPSGPSTDLTDTQRAHVDTLIARVTAKTPASKAYTQRYRGRLADPRVAAGFRAEWKEIVYPIVCERAAGARLWDIDGNEYVDILNGFGQTAFGHAPEFVTDAVRGQLERGFAIGPQSDIAGEVAERFCAMTGNERVTFCNTGSEAVMAAMRIARTVTGRERIVVFGGAYHGQFDEVLVKGAKTSERSVPIAPGIPASSLQNIIVLKYATPETVAWVREHASELAAVIVEPIQSRHPALQPRDFLRELRAITTNSGTALVFDEVVTGFRVHPGGVQALFDIRADLAAYGKVIGGGMPIGILAGRARFMDALDGGTWSYGDDSTPEVAPTFFAGTFVRHPLVMAAVLAVLRHFESHGPALQVGLNERTAGLVSRLNADLEARGLASRIETFASFFFFNFSSEERFASLLYYHMRDRGIYVQEGFPCFLTTAHGEAEVDAIVCAFVESLDELQSAGFFTPEGIEPCVNASSQGCIDVPLTDEQTEVWIAAQGGGDASCAFNESITMRMRGDLDETAFATAFAEVVARHDALRSTFAPSGLTMHIAASSNITLVRRDLCERDACDVDKDLDDHIASDAATPFDLVAGPPARAALLRLAADEHAFVFTAHHLVCDGWSMNTIVSELAALYKSVKLGTPSILSTPARFADYAAKRARRDPARVEALEAYWLERFAEPPKALDLPLDRPRSTRKSYAGASVSETIDAASYAAIKKAGAKNGCTLFVTLLTAFHVLLGRLAGSDDLVVCIPAAGQAVADEATLVGHCVNFLPIRSECVPTSRLGDVLRAVRSRVLEAYENQDYTLGSLLRSKRFPRDPNRLPLVEVQFNLERLPDDVDLVGLETRITPNAKAFVNFDLFLNVIESDAGLRLDWDYNSDLFDRASIETWMRAYRAVLAEIVHDTDVTVETLALKIGDAERVHLSQRELSIVAGLSRPYPNVAIHELFEARAATRPDAIAVSCAGETLTYGELDYRANALARHLRAVVAGDEQRIGISVTRSCDLVIAMLGTLKAGFAYVPLDPTHPTLRRRTILAEAGIAGLIVDDPAAADATPEGVLVVDLVRDRAAIECVDGTALELRVDPDRSAYVIFTSGTTGVPKGVDVAHRSLVNMVTTMAAEPGFDASDVLVAVTTVAFDMAAFEIFVPLAAGGKIVLATSDEIADGYLLSALLERSRATMLQSTPATWRLLLEAGFRSRASFRMLSGGEPLGRALADRLLLEGDGELWNVYGPTETTVYATRSRVRLGEPIAIGSPLDNTHVYVLDEGGQPLERGTIGELYVGGDALARGYLNAPDLTAIKFLPNPFHGGRMFRTGDAARIRADGMLETFGRLDDQVKLRGHRIELGEIETCIARAADVSAVAVALLQHGESARIVGYVVARSAAIDFDELGKRLRTELPDYLVPTTWVALDALPLNPNGKLDRRALPAPAPSTAAPVAFETQLERTLGAIWSEVLGRTKIGRNDDIFALGADSIQIFQIVARAHRLGIEIAARDLMQKRTIGNVASALTSPEPIAGRRLRKAPIARGDSERRILSEPAAL